MLAEFQCKLARKDQKKFPSAIPKMYLLDKSTIREAYHSEIYSFGIRTLSSSFNERRLGLNHSPPGNRTQEHTPDERKPPNDLYRITWKKDDDKIDRGQKQKQI